MDTYFVKKVIEIIHGIIQKKKKKHVCVCACIYTTKIVTGGKSRQMG